VLRSKIAIFDPEDGSRTLPRKPDTHQTIVKRYKNVTLIHKEAWVFLLQKKGCRLWLAYSCYGWFEEREGRWYGKIVKG
jgi:hypothetical protein